MHGLTMTAPDGRLSLEAALVALNAAFELISIHPAADALEGEVDELRDRLLHASGHLTRVVRGGGPEARGAQAVLQVVHHGLSLIGGECVETDAGCVAILLDDVTTAMYALERLIPDLVWYQG